MISSGSTTGLSYKDRRSHQKKRFRFVGVVILVLLIFLFFSSFVLQPWALESISMEPGYPEGVNLLVSPYIFISPENQLRRTPRRGDVVVIAPPYMEEPHWRFKILDPLLRLVTFQKARVRPAESLSWEGERFFKRVIGVPGDTLRMDDSVASVRNSENDYYISEFEMSGKGYDIKVPDLPEGWHEDMPLSGTMDEVVLGEGEYFVLGDNRSSSNDSRYWGPIDESEIRGRVLMTYWPLRNFGRSR